MDDFPYIIDLRARRCGGCGAVSDDTRIFPCPSCGRLTCGECVYLYNDGSTCEHTTPESRHVLTRQDWNA